MKKYLFGLGAMLVGAGLMFVLMHGEVRAEGDLKVSESDFDNFDSTKYRGNLSFKNYFNCNNELLMEKASKDMNYPLGEIKVCKSEKENIICIFNIGTPNLINKHTSMSCMKN